MKKYELLLMLSELELSYMSFLAKKRMGLFVDDSEEIEAEQAIRERNCTFEIGMAFKKANLDVDEKVKGWLRNVEYLPFNCTESFCSGYIAQLKVVETQILMQLVNQKRKQHIGQHHC